MADISRHDLKKNELADFIVIGITWIRNNRNLFFSIAGTVLAVVILAVFFFTRYLALGQRAEDRLSIAQGQLAQGRADQALGLLNEIITKYKNTNAATTARMVKAEYLLSQKNYDEAEKTVLPALTAGKPATVIPLAYSLLGTIREDAGKYKEAIDTYSAFLDKYPEHFLAPKIYESLGRVYELTGSAAQARATYEKLATLYPATEWAQRAQNRLSVLPAPPQPQAPK
jgi:TolA-binding protein